MSEYVTFHRPLAAWEYRDGMDRPLAVVAWSLVDRRALVIDKWGNVELCNTDVLAIRDEGVTSAIEEAEQRESGETSPTYVPTVWTAAQVEEGWIDSPDAGRAGGTDG